LVFVVWTVLQGFIAGQQDRNNLVSGENRKLDAKIRNRHPAPGDRRTARAAEGGGRLQADRNQPVYLFDELTKQTPEGIYLRAIKQDDRRVNINGWAASNERVSEFLRNLQNNSRFLERPDWLKSRSPAPVRRTYSGACSSFP